MRNRNFTLIFALGIIFSLLAGYVIGSAVVQYKIVSKGTIKTVGVEVYADQNCTLPMSEIDWGIRYPSELTSKTVYIKSTSNSLATISISASNWIPTEASNYLTFSSDPNNFTLQPQSIAKATFSLKVSADIQGITDFSFEIWVVAT